LIERRTFDERYSRISPQTVVGIGITAGWHSQRFTCSTFVRVFSPHENRSLTANPNIPTQRCGAVGFPRLQAREDVNQGYWTTLSGQQFLAGVTVCLVGTFLVTTRIHIPMNDRIAT
jgi:hypothetical protein